MKTVAAELRRIDDSLRWSDEAERRDLGRLHADACVTYVLGLPREVPPEVRDEPDRAPAITLTGAAGQWLRLARVEPGPDLRLWVHDGEQDLRIPEVQAAYRVRNFIAHWGEETELTAEIRLPPEARRAIEDRERAEDETRRRRMKEAAPEDRFVTRPLFRAAVLLGIVTFLLAVGYVAALLFVPELPAAAQVGGGSLVLAGLLLSPWLFYRRHVLIVDRAGGEIREQLIGREHVLAKLSTVRHADVAGGRVVLVLTDAEPLPIGREAWPIRRHVQIAECVNDSIDLPASRRKVLRYRRDAGERGSA